MAEPNIDNYDIAVNALNIDDLYGENELNIANDVNKKNKIKEVYPDESKIFKLINVGNILTSLKLDSKFNNVFDYDKNPLTINKDKVYRYYNKNTKTITNPFIRSKERTAIRIVCAAYFEQDDSGANKTIIIASRLDTYHKDQPVKPQLSTEPNPMPSSKSLGQDEKIYINNILSELLKNTNNATKRVKLVSFNDDFRNKMFKILNPKSTMEENFSSHTTVYEKYLTSMDLSSLNKKIIKFNVEFSIIFVAAKDMIYYSKKIIKLDETQHTYEGVYADNQLEIMFPNEHDDKKRYERETDGQATDIDVTGNEEVDMLLGLDQGQGQNLRASGGKRKITRKQLNTMTLTELKQLHKVNKIKMNNNRTIKALINNYIKNNK
jgi:hypothetical protein